jgi:hypothetical protein
VKVSMNSPICRKGLCSESIMGMGIRWNASHEHYILVAQVWLKL